MSELGGGGPRLGRLEATVMDCVWEVEGTLSVREVMDLLRRDRQIAYTTVMTVMENLHRKGLLRRELRGRAYHYRSVRSREEHTTQVISQVLAFSRDRTATLLHFVDQMDPDEVTRLRDALTSPDPDTASQPRPPSSPLPPEQD